LATILSLIILIILVSRLITQRLSHLNKQVQVVAGGDFRLDAIQGLRTKREDEMEELARSFIQLHATVRSLLGEMTTTGLALNDQAAQMEQVADQSAESAQQVAQAVMEMAAGASTQAGGASDAAETVADLQRAITEIAAGAQEQALAVQQTAGTVQEMLLAIEAVAQNSAGVAATSFQATQTAAAGAAVVERTVKSMGAIQATVQISAERLGALGAASAQIGTITQAITEIAEQTNLLALNAAIEAARAGDAGRGFAVVADEVRKLAERAARSASEIAGLVQTIQGATAAAVKAMGEGTAEVQAGSRLATEAGASLAQILAGAEATTASIQEISAAAQQLAASSRRVAGAFEQVSAVTERSSAATEEMAAGAEQVNQTIQSVAAISQGTAATGEEVAAATEQITAATEGVAESAKVLLQVAAQLRRQVTAFRL
jgi:methyl-accepting chemotaxis protein